MVTRELQNWVWVFGDVGGLRWVLDRATMAFPATAGPRLDAMGHGDLAVLYVTRTAFNNPTRDVSRLAGLVTVRGTPGHGRPVFIARREFTWTVPIDIDVTLPERLGPEVYPLVPRLSFVSNKRAWGQYFRTSPRRIESADFDILAAAVREAAAAPPPST